MTPQQKDATLTALDSVLEASGFGSSRHAHTLVAWDKSGSSRYVFKFVVSRSGETELEMTPAQWRAGSSALRWPIVSGVAEIATRDLLARKELLSHTLAVMPRAPLVDISHDALPSTTSRLFELYRDPKLAAESAARAIRDVAKKLGSTPPAPHEPELAYDSRAVSLGVRKARWCGAHGNETEPGSVSWERGDGISLRVVFPVSQSPIVQAWLPDIKSKSAWFAVWGEPFVSAGHESFLVESISGFVESFSPPSFERCVEAWEDRSSWVVDGGGLWAVFWRRAWDVNVAEPSAVISSGYSARLDRRWMMTFDVTGFGSGFLNPTQGPVVQQQYFLERDEETGAAVVYSDPMQAGKQGASWVPDKTDFVHMFHPVSNLSADSKVFRETIRSFA